MKIQCNICREFKHHSDFHKKESNSPCTARRHYASYCKPCQKHYMREYFRKRREKGGYDVPIRNPKDKTNLSEYKLTDEERKILDEVEGV